MGTDRKVLGDTRALGRLLGTTPARKAHTLEFELAIAPMDKTVRCRPNNVIGIRATQSTAQGQKPRSPHVDPVAGRERHRGPQTSLLPLAWISTRPRGDGSTRYEAMAKGRMDAEVDDVHTGGSFVSLDVAKCPAVVPGQVAGLVVAARELLSFFFSYFQAAREYLSLLCAMACACPSESRALHLLALASRFGSGHL